MSAPKKPKPDDDKEIEMPDQHTAPKLDTPKAAQGSASNKDQKN